MKATRPILLTLFLLVPITGVNAAGFAMSDNFTVFTPAWPSNGEAQKYAELLLGNAEAFRKEIAKKWLGEELPPSVGQTTINVSFSEQQDIGRVWIKDDPRRRFHTLYLSTSPDKALGSTLAHEMTHIVLATRFPPPNRLPPWLEEGVANTYADLSRKAMLQRILSWTSQTGNWPDLKILLNTEKILARDRAAYAAASSLTSYLLSRGDRKTLFAFALEGAKSGWDQALIKHYQINGVPELQTGWQQWVNRTLKKES